MKKYILKEEQLKTIIENWNVPADSMYDSNAPWNQSEPEYSKAEKRDTSGFNVMYRYGKELAIINDGKHIFALDLEKAIDDNLYDYVEVPYNSNDDIYDKEHAEIEDDDILIYFVDYLKTDKVGVGLDDWESGMAVVKVNTELMDYLKKIFKFKLSDLSK